MEANRLKLKFKKLGEGVRNLFGAPTSLAALSSLSKIASRAGTFLIVAPIIGPTNQGTIVGTSAWSAVILLIAAYGFQVRVLRQVAMNPHKAFSVVMNDLIGMAVLSVPAIMIAFVAYSFKLALEYGHVFTIMFVATFASIVGDYCSCALRGLGSFFRETVIALVTSILQLVCAVGAALEFDSLIYLALAILVSRLIYAFVSLLAVFTQDIVRRSDRDDIVPVFHTIRVTFPYFVDGSLSVLLSQIDIILLTFLADRETIGIYSVGSRLVQLFLVIPWIATTVMVPAIATAEGTERYAAELVKLLKGFGLVAAAGSIGMLGGGPFFTSVILGDRFVALDALWLGFALLTLSRFYEAFFGIIMTALGRLVERVFVQVVAVGLICIGSVILVPRIGAIGLISTISTTYCIVGGVYARRLLLPSKFGIQYAYLFGVVILLSVFGAAAWGRMVAI